MPIPANPSDARQTSAATAAVEAAHPARLRVLVMKDTGGGHAYLGALRTKGFEIDVVAHGEPAATAVLARRQDAIILEQSASPDRATPEPMGLDGRAAARDPAQ